MQTDEDLKIVLFGTSAIPSIFKIEAFYSRDRPSDIVVPGRETCFHLQNTKFIPRKWTLIPRILYMYNSVSE